MSRWGLVAGLIGLALVCVPAAQAAWHQPVGGASPINDVGGQLAKTPDLTVINGVPYVAWSEADGTQDDARVARLNAAGTAWEQVVGGANPINVTDAQDASDTSLTAIGGVPYIAWTESDGVSAKARVSKLDAGTDWVEIVPGANPINHDATKGALGLTMTAIDGVPYVAWHEFDGLNTEVRVSRLNPAGNDWVELGPAASPVNLSITGNAANPSLASVGGVPYVAWDEDDGVNRELRVSRLNAAGTDWDEVVGGTSPINHENAAGRNASAASLRAINGVLYVAWTENDGVNTEVRVSRLNGAGTDWVELVGGASPINHANNLNAFQPSLSSVDGVPYVSWSESDGTNFELRVSRLNEDETAWEEVVGGASPINDSSATSALGSSLAFVGGTPYVAWAEGSGTNDQIRVGRLEPDFSAQLALPGETGAVLFSRVETFGVPAKVAFDFGSGAGLDQRTPVVDVSGRDGSDTVAQTVAGLAPKTAYSFRPVGVDDTYTLTPGATSTFSTGPFGGTPVTLLLAAITNSGRTIVQGKRVAVDYLATGAGTVELDVNKGTKRVARLVGTAAVGRNRLTWNGKAGSKAAKPGKYTLLLTVTSDDGQIATDSGQVKLKRAGTKR